MLDEELRQSPFPITWDNTMRAGGHQCKRKLYWFLRGYDYKGKPSYFTWGSAFQEILVYWYSNPHPPDPEDKQFWEMAYLALDKGKELYDREIGDIEPNRDNSRDNLERIFTNYIQTYPSEAWEVIPGGAEVGWIWPIMGTDYEMGGSLDGRIHWDSYGALVLENKTTSEYLSDGFISRWHFSGQVTGYIWYLKQLLGDSEVYGCLMNLITKKVPGPKSSWTTQRVVRDVVKKSKAQLSEFVESFLWDVEAVKRCWTSWIWPMTADPTNCTGGAGKAPCLFRNVCLQHQPFTKVDPLQFQGIQLRSGKWAPWEREGDQD